jgi:uncharacterized coiled-coil protein SlyX
MKTQDVTEIENLRRTIDKISEIVKRQTATLDRLTKELEDYKKRVLVKLITNLIDSST